MFRPSGTIVLPFWIKKASLALRMESRLEEIFSMGINCMSLVVWTNVCRRMYADDTNVTFSAASIHDLESQINSNLKYIDRWLEANKLGLGLVSM